MQGGVPRNCEIAVRSDCADLFEVKSCNSVQRWPHRSRMCCKALRSNNRLDQQALPTAGYPDGA